MFHIKKQLLQTQYVVIHIRFKGDGPRCNNDYISYSFILDTLCKDVKVEAGVGT